MSSSPSTTSSTNNNDQNGTSTKNDENDDDNDNVITTIIFDVDDTLYDVSSGFTKHRNGEVVQQYMVDHLGFDTLQHAKSVRDEYFVKYHATAKALTVAQAEGKFPKTAPKFNTQHLADYWATNLDYSKLGEPKSKQFIQQLQELKNSSGITLVAFSNGPRKYVKRVLQYLNLFKNDDSDDYGGGNGDNNDDDNDNNDDNDECYIFNEDTLYAVDDVLPYCKPEKEAFEKIFQNVGNPNPSSCIMVEDSMKNIRVAKSLGMKTILVKGKESEDTTTSMNENGKRILPEDAPIVNDPAVDCCIDVIEDLYDAVPGLWVQAKSKGDKPRFNPKPLIK